MWPQGAEGPEISFDDFVEYVLPRDFENLKELQKVFYDKVNLNAGALQEVRHTALTRPIGLGRLPDGRVPERDVSIWWI